MEELFLGAVLAADELHIVDQQHVHGAEALLESHSVLMAQSVDKAEHELFRRKINHMAGRIALTNLPGDGVHQVGLAQTNPAVDVKGIERSRTRLGKPLGSGVGEFVGFATDEGLEGEAFVQGRGQFIRR